MALHPAVPTGRHLRGIQDSPAAGLALCPNRFLTVWLCPHTLSPPTPTTLGPPPFPPSFPPPTSSHSQTRKPFSTSWWSWLPLGSSECLRVGKTPPWGAGALVSHPDASVCMETVEPGSHSRVQLTYLTVGIQLWSFVQLGYVCVKVDVTEGLSPGHLHPILTATHSFSSIL